MAYTKENLNDIFSRIAVKLDISDTLFEIANKEYTALGKWIDKESDDYSVSIYPQGSFALGTVIRPISDEDDYDIDLVCEFAEQYGLSAKELKQNVVKPWLENYRHIDKIEEKRRCWHVEYSELNNFHMDVIPAYNKQIAIQITDLNEENGTYEYIDSNPKGYESWFMGCCKQRRLALYEQYCKENSINCEDVDIEKLPKNKYKTPLQKAVQLLKRHRDIMFDGDDNKPISIIITTLAGQLYNNEDNIVDAIATILSQAEHYIEKNKKSGNYFIENPSCKDDNFANKWNEYPERAKAFFSWLHAAQIFFDPNRLMNLDKITMGREIKKTFGENLGKTILNEMAEEERKSIESGNYKVSAKVGGLALDGKIAVPPNHHHG